MPAPFFSVCIPQYNRTSFLLEVCRSLAAQTFRDFEICISDDRSTDGREAEILSFLSASGLRFTYQRRETNGRYDANLRSALSLATGRFCFLLGNDDALKSAETLGQVRNVLDRHSGVGVLFTNFEDFASGHPVRKARRTRALGSGPLVAANAFRRFSFVSGIVLDAARAQAETTARWDGSEMYQMFVGCRMIAAGALAVETDLVAIRKDIRIAGESVDSYARSGAAPAAGIPEQMIPLVQHARLVADAVAPFPRGRSARVTATIASQFFGLLLPYWLLEYRRVRSWRYAAGVARAMRPSSSWDGAQLPTIVRAWSWVLWSAAAMGGLLAPVVALRVVHAPARRLARLAEEWGA